MIIIKNIKYSLIALAFLLFCSGCSTTKVTWRDVLSNIGQGISGQNFGTQYQLYNIQNQQLRQDFPIIK